MAEQGYITEAMAKVALAEPGAGRDEKGAGSVNYAADYVMDTLDDTVGAIDEDIVVTTTIDPRMQALAEHALTGELDAKGAKFNVGQGALVALDPDGAVKALVGGRNYADSQFNRAIAAKRQPGLVLQAVRLSRRAGEGPDRPTRCARTRRSTSRAGRRRTTPRIFRPRDADQGASLSLNTVAVRLGLEVGPKAVVKTAHRLGILRTWSRTPRSRSALRR